jgi:mannose-1-phosphate guanylyltransferase
MIDHLYAVVMAGGGGTRLWPMSRKQHPKQTLTLTGSRTLFQVAVDRLLPLITLEQIFVVTTADQVDSLYAQYPQIPKANFIVEPQGRGTASCIGLSALILKKVDPDATMIVVTADHYIADVDTFRDSLRAARDIAEEGYLVTMGIEPTNPSTGYGYIEQGELLGEVDGFEYYRVAKFTEKPDFPTARAFLEAGNYAWNSGMFIWRADRILDEIQRQMSELDGVLKTLNEVDGVEDFERALHRLWPSLPKETIDYGVMENADRVAVIPNDIGWSDIGIWASVKALYSEDADGNVMIGDVLDLDSQDTMVLADGERFIATIGLDDVIVVDTPDALLITRGDQSQRVKEIVQKLKDQERDNVL